MTDKPPEAQSRARWLMPATCLAAGAVGALITMAVYPGFISPAEPATQAAVEKAIMENPQIIPNAINRLQAMEVEKLLASNREAIETPYAGAWAGAKDGDVVLVEFFDFNCPFCRQSSADVERLLEEDPKLKVVFRDFPVLGPDSEQFARASLSAAEQGQEQYLAFYRNIFRGQGALSQERLIQSARAARLDESKVAASLTSRSIGAELERTMSLGRALGLTGTPSYVIGNEILSGAVGYEALKEAIAKARSAGKGR